MLKPNGNRCLPTGIDSVMLRFGMRIVDEQGAVHAHRGPRAFRGNICGENICQAEPEPQHLPAIGQYNCFHVHQQNGKHTFKHPIQQGMQPLAIAPSEKHHTVCTAAPGDTQHNSRC